MRKIPAFAFLAALTAAQSAFAATYYVATTGSNSNPGTNASPLLTIPAGVSKAVAGDTIIVADGTYGGCTSGGFAVSINKAGNSSGWITLKAANKGKAILDGQTLCHSYFNMQGSSAYWIIQGFDIRNARWSAVWSNSGGGKNIKILNNIVQRMGMSFNLDSGAGIVGVFFDAGGTNITIDGNVFHDIGRQINGTGSWDHSIYTHGTNSVISNNVFYTVYNGWHIQTASGFSGTIANNVFFGPNPFSNQSGQIMIWSSQGSVTIRNNIFYGARNNGIQIYNASFSGACTIDRNIVYTPGASVALVSSLPSACSQSLNQVNVDPKLTAPALPNWNFTPLAGSPAIDRGAAASGVTADFNGVTRPVGAAWDIGAYETGGASSTADTTAPAITGIAASGIGQTGATIGWTTNEPADTQVEYGLTTAYGASTVLNVTLSTTHSAVLAGLTAGTLYHYRVKSRDAAGNLATSADASFTTSAASTAPGCVTSAGAWANAAIAPQTGAFTVEFDAVPSMAKMDGLVGLANGAATAYTSLATAVRFNNAGAIDARNGAAYAAAISIPYAAGASYHIRIPVNLTARTYSVYVRQGSAAEQMLASGYAFRTEQNTVTTLNGLGLFASAGGLQICAVKTTSGSTADVTPPVVTGVAVSQVSQTGATVGWTTNEAADTQVEYGATAAYGSSTALNTTRSTTHSVALTGLAPATLYRYRVKSRDAAGNLATSADATFTTAATSSGSCIVSAGGWTNAALTPQSGSFIIEFDAVPSMAKMDGVVGLSNGAAAAYSSLATGVRFNNAGAIDARNGGAYAAAVSIPYAAGTVYHIRMAVSVAAHTYSVYVKQGSSSEQLLAAGYSFRTDQNTATTLSALALFAGTGGLQICGTAVTVSGATADAAPPVISGVASAGGATGATISWTTNEPADTLVEYGLTTAYGASTVLNAALSTSHGAVISGLTPSALYHYRVKSKDAAGNLATSGDYTFTTSAPGAACITAAGGWANLAFPSQTGAFTLEFDAVPSIAKMDGLAGASQNPAADYNSVAVSVRFNNAGFIDARDGAAFKTVVQVPYAGGTTYRFRLPIDVGTAKYSAYVRTGSGAEQLIGSNYSFRVEPGASKPAIGPKRSLANLAVYTSAGSATVCGVTVK